MSAMGDDMNRIWVLASAVFVFAISAQRPAEANISTSTIVETSPNPSLDRCPVTLTFAATVTGAPGTRFTLSFNHFHNDVQLIAMNTPAVIPANGVLKVADSMTLTEATVAGKRNFDQVFAHNIAGQADVYSNIAAFSVTCGAPPTPGGSTLPSGRPPRSHLNVLYDYKIYGLTSTNDPGVCADHYAGGMDLGLNTWLCQALIKPDAIVLVWNPRASADPDEYRVYRIDNGQHVLVDTVRRGDQGVTPTVSGLKKPSDGFNGKCYAVSAFKSNESGLSNTYCIGAAVHLGTSKVSLYPSGYSRTKYHFSEPGLPTQGIPSINLGYCVGYYHLAKQNAILRDTQYADYCRAYLMFDTAEIKNLKLLKATLALRIYNGSKIPVCVTQIGEPTTEWVGNTDKDFMADASFWAPTMSRVGNELHIDVTDIVRRWVNGAPNLGLALRGASEDTGAFDNNICREGIAARLDVEEFR